MVNNPFSQHTAQCYLYHVYVRGRGYTRGSWKWGLPGETAMMIIIIVEDRPVRYIFRPNIPARNGWKKTGRRECSEEGERFGERATRNFSSGILAALNGTSAGGHRGKIYIPREGYKIGNRIGSARVAACTCVCVCVRTWIACCVPRLRESELRPEL